MEGTYLPANPLYSGEGTKMASAFGSGWANSHTDASNLGGIRGWGNVLPLESHWVRSLPLLTCLSQLVSGSWSGRNPRASALHPFRPPLWLADHSKVDVLGLRNKHVNSAAKTSPHSPNW